MHMITMAELLSYKKESLPQIADTLQPDEISQLVDWLAEKNDRVRYPAFLLLQNRSVLYPDVCPYQDVFLEKLTSGNAYQRSIGLMLLAENAKWDETDRFGAFISRYLSFCDDEKPVTVRQCIQGLQKVVPYKKELCPEIAAKLMSVDIGARKVTQRKILLLDILHVLILVNSISKDEEIESYILQALTGDILDKKAKAEIHSLL